MFVDKLHCYKECNMKNYTYILLGALAISSAILAETVRLSENQYPASQKAETIIYTERDPQSVYKESLPQQTERRIGERLREEDRLRDAGYRGVRRDRWHYADEDYRPGDDYYRRGHWRDDRGRLGDSRVFPWNW